MRKKLLLILISIFIILSSSKINGNLLNNISFELGPYPQNTKFNSTDIIWQTNVQTVNNSVHFGLNPDCNLTIYQNNKTGFHRIRIDKLQPSQKYYYKVKSDGIISDVYSFHTAFGNKESIKFIIYGDTRGVWDNWKNASKIANLINKEKPHFLLHTGDFVKDGRSINQWIDFFSISTFLHNCTLYPVIGNHEYYNESYLRYFTISDNCYWYSFDNGPIHFIGLDSNKKNRYNLEQTLWLINDLLNNNKPYTIVFFHHPPYSSGNHGSSHLIRLIWSPLFSFFNVDIVFNGHDHCYERAKVNNVNYIVTGGGGAPLYKVNKRWWTIHSEMIHHFCIIEADQNTLLFQVKKSEGAIIDKFSIEN